MNSSRWILHTDRLALSPVRHADIAELHALWMAPAVRRFLWDGESIPVDRTTEIVTTSQQRFRERRFGLWAARPLTSPELIGFGGFWQFRDEPEEELLFGVHESAWGHGYATEIGRALVRYGLAVLGFDRIRASADADNVASVRVLEKLGFRSLRRSVVRGLDTRFFQLHRREASW